MNLRYLLIATMMAWACGTNAPAQTCTKDAGTLISVIQQEAKLPFGFAIRGAEVPSLEEAFLSIQVDAAHSVHPKVQEVKFCEFAPFMFQLDNGTVTGASVELDSESKWLIGLGPKDERFPLAGFSDPLSGFNALVRTLELKVQNPHLASSIFDLYLRLVGGHKFRDSIIVDEMELQSMGLSDFRLRYSLPKARMFYAQWWRGVSPAVKSELRRPDVKPDPGGFKITYFRYSQGRILSEAVDIGEDGAVATAGSKAIYAPVISTHNHTVGSNSNGGRAAAPLIATTKWSACT